MCAEQNRHQAWLLLTFGEKRQYAGNSGYEDDPQNVYHYDSTVPNHKRIAEGDVAVIRGNDRLLGVARIERISSYSGQKIRLRCPECNSVHLKKRKRVTPPFRCENKHIFEIPLEERIECTNFKAFFGKSFISTPGVVSIAALRKACPRYSEQFAMQMIDVQAIATALLAATPDTQHLIDVVISRKSYLAAEDAERQDETGYTVESAPYVPIDDDRRDSVTRTIRARRGQQAFRQSLIARYGPQCMVTGCNLLDVVEAAHISPYRGLNDQHEENGLLLRADIHVLFDLDLMGIDPVTLRVTFHPIVLGSGYQQWEGQKLHCHLSPSLKALKAKWVLFNKRLQDKS